MAGLVTGDSIVNPDKKLSDAGVNVVIDHVTDVDRGAKKVSTESGNEYTYDKLIMSTGSSPVLPPIPGKELEGVFTLRSLRHAEAIQEFMARQNPRELTLIGAGFISLEIAVLLKQANPDHEITIVELLKHPLSAMLDEEMCNRVEEYLKGRGLKLKMEEKVVEIRGNGRVSAVKLESGETIKSDMVFMNVGTAPNLGLAKNMGLEIGPYGIKVNQFLETSDPDILAAGDCADNKHFVTGRSNPGALRGPAVLMGRLAAKRLAGYEIPFPGILNASACNLIDMNVAATGLTEDQAHNEGIETVSAAVDSRSKHGMIPGTSPWTLKLVFDASKRTIIGGQILSTDIAPVKEIDTVSALILGKKTVEELTVFAAAGNPDISSEPSMEPITIVAEQCLQKLGRP
ncbi:MAG: FAD-dependent oxidoreductase [Thermodesulfobacteriota bacterium]|nr:FAD-dependent oxidoreductase [Thermodesulfobacteriota bacterium]